MNVIVRTQDASKPRSRADRVDTPTRTESLTAIFQAMANSETYRMLLTFAEYHVSRHLHARARVEFLVLV